MNTWVRFCFVFNICWSQYTLLVSQYSILYNCHINSYYWDGNCSPIVQWVSYNKRCELSLFPFSSSLLLTPLSKFSTLSNFFSPSLSFSLLYFLSFLFPTLSRSPTCSLSLSLSSSVCLCRSVFVSLLLSQSRSVCVCLHSLPYSL